MLVAIVEETLAMLVAIVEETLATLVAKAAEVATRRSVVDV
tara:strand:- start:511 stop:633 length:123 start_codon:yes stop_codon:yes gene_type:complete